MGILSWILLGLVAGALAKAIRPGKDPGGCIITILIGIIGAVVGGFIATRLGWGDVDGFNLYSILVATGGAILALIIWAAIIGRRRDYRYSLLHKKRTSTEVLNYIIFQKDNYSSSSKLIASRVV